MTDFGSKNFCPANSFDLSYCKEIGISPSIQLPGCQNRSLLHFSRDLNVNIHPSKQKYPPKEFHLKFLMQMFRQTDVCTGSNRCLNRTKHSFKVQSRP